MGFTVDGTGYMVCKRCAQAQLAWWYLGLAGAAHYTDKQQAHLKRFSELSGVTVPTPVKGDASEYLMSAALKVFAEEYAQKLSGVEPVRFVGTSEPSMTVARALQPIGDEHGPGRLNLITPDGMAYLASENARLQREVSSLRDTIDARNRANSDLRGVIDELKKGLPRCAFTMPGCDKLGTVFVEGVGPRCDEHISEHTNFEKRDLPHAAVVRRFGW